MNNLFNQKILAKKAEEEIDLSKHNFSERRKALNKWIKNLENGVLDKSKEEEFQGEFLYDIFTTVLRAVNKSDGKNEWNLERETKTKLDGQKADGVLGFFDADGKKDVRAVIELKGAKVSLDVRQKRTGDTRTPVEQAFNYAPKYGKNCQWVIVSNYKEIRLYRSNDMTEYQVFFLEKLKDDLEFKKFIYILSFDALVGTEKKKAKTIELSEEYQKNQSEIEKKFYNEYKAIRLHIFENMRKNNPAVNENTIIEKVQKLLDRFLFICFCEDKGLLPNEIFYKTLEKGKNFGDVFEVFKMLCNWINLGNPRENISHFNGGLFKNDDVLEGLYVDNEVFEEMKKISEYDFDSELNENILGHIFEQSISDIEDLKKELNGEEFDKKKGKRKKDGIFYTPKYITKYIVENSIKNWLDDKRKELGEDKLPELSEADFEIKYSSKKSDERIFNKNYKKHIEFWTKYREAVKNIKVVDPACGSGAFLITAFEYLLNYNNYLNDKIFDLTGTKDLFSDTTREILQNNIFGVDLNKESVEITKLSLWLKTANKNKTLATLENNIKCGNSLIDDIEIAGELAFNWEKEFPQVFNTAKNYQNFVDTAIARGQDPLSETKKIQGKDRKVWTQKYGKKEIYSEELLFSTMEYINNNREKHNLEPYCKEIKKVIEKEIVIPLPKALANIKKPQNVQGHELHNNKTEKIIDKKNLMTLSEARDLDPLSNIKIYHITTALHNSRISERMIKYKVNKSNDIQLLTSKEELLITKVIAKIRLDDNLKILAYNICQDHIHLLIISEENNIENTVKKIKSLTARKLNQYRENLAKNNNMAYENFNNSNNSKIYQNLTDATRGQDPLSGFDVVVGNPPYVRVQGLKENYLEQTKYYEKNYVSATGSYDIYALFMEKGFKLINKKGLVSFILPHKFLITDFGSGIRKFFVEKRAVESLLHFGSELVFSEASTYTCIVTLSKKNKEKILFKKVNPNKISEIFKWDKMDYNLLSNKNWDLQSEEIYNLIKKLKKQPYTVEEVFKSIFQGIATSLDDVYVFEGKEEGNIIKGYNKKFDYEFEIEKELVKPILGGKEVSKYCNMKIKNYVLFPYHRINNKMEIVDIKYIENNLPLTKKYLENFEKEIKGREKGKMSNRQDWYAYIYPKNLDKFDSSKIMTREISLGCNMTYDSEGKIYHNTKVYSFVKNKKFNVDDKFYLALLNSKVMWFFIKNTGSEYSGGYYVFKTNYLKPFPLPEIPDNAEMFIEKADKMLFLNKNLQELSQKFQRLLTRKFELEKLTTKLQDWYLLKFSEFVKELKKSKIKLSLKEEMEWEEIFLENKEEAEKIKNEIEMTDKEIDRMVYELYGLNEEEVMVVEKS